MIGSVVKLLQTTEFYNVSKEVEIAKGRYQYVNSWKKFIAQIRRAVNSNYYV